MKRRNFIIGTAAGLVTNQVATRVAGSANLPLNPFTLGVASGDVTQDSVVLWTRLAPQPLTTGGGMGRDALPVRWEVFADAALQQSVRRGEELAVPEFAHSVHVDLQELEPDTVYWYRFTAGGYTSAAGRARTLPAPDSQPAAVRFVTVSCQNYTHGYFTAYDHIVADRPDFLVHLGDYIYETSYGETFRRHETEQMAFTLDGYRKRHARYKADASLQRAHASIPFFTMPDNHDAVIDTSPSELAKRAAAYQAWYEHMPVRGYQRDGFRLSRTISIGDLLQLNLLDTRQFRDRQALCAPPDDPAFGFGNYRERCPEIFVAQRTMLGREQEGRLTASILRNKAIWPALASASVFLPFNLHRDGKTFNYLGSWDGYPANRDRVTAALNQAGIVNTVILSGDMHSFWALDGARLEPAVPAVEFVTSSVSANWPEQMSRPISDSMNDNPQLRFYEPDQRGYLLHEVSAQTWHVTARAVSDVRNAQAHITDLARFTVTHGKAGFKATSLRGSLD
ncbi:MAG: alkaline phosphatase D family protein [Gammaproteobacteria bacterium]|nr:alkaline phosphatase D family protein [Gammaproteobacteria bacterium]MCY4283092.1 alkaline phosphatase D family protein [Gammaproteobacteria bacterium]